MNRPRMFLLALIALALSGVVTFLIYRVINERLRPAEDTVSIVVVNQKIALGTRLTRAELQTMAWPKAVALPGSFHELDEVLGRGVIVPMEPSEPVLEAKLAPKNGGAGLMTAIPDGMRALSVKVNDVIGVAGFVVPGSRVDVILSGTPPSTGGSNDVAKVILENVQVLAAGQRVDRDAEGKPVNAQVITLLVTPEDSERLALVTADGRIHLALRNPLDMEAAHPRAVERSELYTGLSSAPPSPAPAPAPPKKIVKAAPAVKTPPPPPHAPVAVAPVSDPAPKPLPPQFVDVMLIQGSSTQHFKFETKP
jgi:pilus assembly protein CpaB